MAPTPEWTSEHDFTLDGVSYRSMTNRSAPDQMVLLKTREMVEGYEALLAELQPRRVLELGIYSGGSAALISQLARPDKLVALDIVPDCPPLERFIDAHDLRDRLAAHYGVDQADVDRLDQIMDAEFGGVPIDLVLDDASHLDGPTRASFNRLFPHLRPGGVYLLEDWSWAHNRLAHHETAYQGVTPMSALILELVLASACRPRVVAEVTVRYHWVIVRRGPADLHPSRFDLSAQFDPVGQAMIDRLRTVRSLEAEADTDVLRGWR